MQTSLIAQNNKGASALFILKYRLKRFQKVLDYTFKDDYNECRCIYN
jgi:hypothetical protein